MPQYAITLEAIDPYMPYAEMARFDNEFQRDRQFPDIKSAKEYCAHIVQKYPKVKLNVEKYYSWDAIMEAERREYRRFEEDEYLPLPNWFPAYTHQHFLHLPKDVDKLRDGWVAYTPNKDYFIADRQVVIPASKYLAKYFKDRYRSEQIAAMQSRLIVEFSATKFAITQDVDLLRKAYMTPDLAAESSNYASCMAYNSENFDLPEPMHPADAYFFDDPTQSDFSLAYLYRDIEGCDDIDIVARAMVLHKTKAFVRVYGTSEHVKSELARQLKELGYCRVENYVGTRLCLRQHPNKPNYVIVPYIDGDTKYVTEGGKIVCSGDRNAYYQCDTTAGYIHKSGGVERDDDDNEDYEEQDEPDNDDDWSDGI